MSKRPRRSYLPKLEERERADLAMVKLASIEEEAIDDQRREKMVAAHSALPDWAVPEMVDAIAAAKELQPANQGEIDYREMAACDVCLDEEHPKTSRLMTWPDEGMCEHGFCDTCAHSAAYPPPLRIWISATRFRMEYQRSECPFCRREVQSVIEIDGFDSGFMR